MPIGWNPWHGCTPVSEGCRHCYVYRTDALHGIDPTVLRLTGAFRKPILRRRDGRYVIPPGERVYTALSSDFFHPDADEWRHEAWAMIRARSDLEFHIITKRIDRLAAILPAEWGEGWEHVHIGCTVENQAMADRRLPLFLDVPLRHRFIVCEPLLGPIDLTGHLDARIEEVSVGGESGPDARLCDFVWVEQIRTACIDRDVSFHYHQTGALLRKEGRLYRIPRPLQHAQAHRAGIDYRGSAARLRT